MGPKAPTDTGRRVGELAGAAGLTVRTLHYYDEIGLLSASARSGSGHRLYSDADVERLYRVCLLRRLGLSLREISRVLDDPAWSLQSALAAHLAVLDRRLEATSRLRSHLSRLIASASATSPTDELLAVLEEMTMLDTTVQRRISILVYADLEAAFDYLVRVFGLGPGELIRDDSGHVVHGELQVGDGVVWLHREAPPVWRSWSMTWTPTSATRPPTALGSSTSRSTSPMGTGNTAPGTAKAASGRS